MLELCLKFKFHTNRGLFLNQCLCLSRGGEGAGSISYMLYALTMVFSITAGVKGGEWIAKEENKTAAGENEVCC